MEEWLGMLFRAEADIPRDVIMKTLMEALPSC